MTYNDYRGTKTFGYRRLGKLFNVYCASKWIVQAKVIYFINQRLYLRLLTEFLFSLRTLWAFSEKHTV